MDDCFILDNSINYVVSKSVTKYKYELMDFKPHIGVSFQVWCYNDVNEFVSHFTGEIIGEEYAAWGDDDAYIDDLIEGKVIARFS